MRPSAAFIALALFVSGCATIPADRYGVARLRLEGVEAVDPEALRACLATTERDSFELNLGTSTDLACGVPPFDGGRLRLRMWSWPWSDWPTLDLAVFDRDVERVERWYRARGFYDARVLSTELTPSAATTSDRVEDANGEPLCAREDEDEGCRVEVTITVEEGDPVLVEWIEISVDDTEENISPDDVDQAVELEVGERFDEAHYDRSRDAVVATLREQGYACAAVDGQVNLDPATKRATVRYRVHPGPKSVFGTVEMRVSGEVDYEIPERVVLGAVDIDEGDTYAPTLIANAQRAVYSLGAFSSVQLDAVPRLGAGGECVGIVDVEVEVTPGRPLRYGIGGGIRSGDLNDTTTTDDVPQWDVHLLLFAEHRNFLGGLRRLRIEDRPKLVFRSQFPDPIGEEENADRPTLGNELKLEFRQPGFLEARTTLTATSRWDLGPDPNQPSIFRHDLDQGFVLSRPFFGGKVLFSSGFRVNLYRIPPALNSASAFTESSNYQVLFLEQYLQIDLRDDPRSARRGFYMSIGAQEAGLAAPKLGVSTWRYFRITPEVRGYVPLPLGMVIAARFAVGAMLINYVDPRIASDVVSTQLGPTRYRLRGGGPSSHRGYSSATLGSVPEPIEPWTDTSGGLRRWEGSLELRMPIDEDFGVVAFGDVGDVNQEPVFRFNYIHLALGVGLRYQTIVGPLRVDFGFLIPHAQVIGEPEPATWWPNSWAGGNRVKGAINITIGEAF